jgi:hypothetical protein
LSCLSFSFLAAASSISLPSLWPQIFPLFSLPHSPTHSLYFFDRSSLFSASFNSLSLLHAESCEQLGRLEGTTREDGVEGKGGGNRTVVHDSEQQNHTKARRGRKPMQATEGRSERCYAATSHCFVGQGGWGGPAAGGTRRNPHEIDHEKVCGAKAKIFFAFLKAKPWFFLIRETDS